MMFTVLHGKASLHESALKLLKDGWCTEMDQALCNVQTVDQHAYIVSASNLRPQNADADFCMVYINIELLSKTGLERWEMRYADSLSLWCTNQ